MEITTELINVFLSCIYRAINHEFFQSELPDIPVQLDLNHWNQQNDNPAAAVQFTPGTKSIKGIFLYDIPHELIAEKERILEYLFAMILHEAIHVYCISHGLKDFDYETREHLESFQEIADRVGLIYDDIWNDDFTQVIKSVNFTSWSNEEIIQLISKSGDSTQIAV